MCFIQNHKPGYIPVLWNWCTLHSYLLRRICCCFQAFRDNHPISRAVSSHFLVSWGVWPVFIHIFQNTTNLEWECSDVCSGTVIYTTISNSTAVINRQLCQTGVWILFVYLACLYFNFSKHGYFVPDFVWQTNIWITYLPINHCHSRTSPTM